ncbi:MAG: hypothetical protein GY722_08015 [bacterium]|nr:hypothetical protein [bacterium]
MRSLALVAGGCLFLVLVAAPEAVQAGCESVYGNGVGNCGFETGDPPESWEVVNGEDFQRAVGGFSGSYSGSLLGAGSAIPEVRTAYLQSNCFAVAAREYVFGANIRRDFEASCFCSLISYEDAGCQGETSGMSSGWIYLATDDWIAAGGAGTPQGQSARLVLFCEAWSGWMTPFLFDEAFAGPVPTQVDIPAISGLGTLSMLLLLAFSGLMLLARSRGLRVRSTSQ